MYTFKITSYNFSNNIMFKFLTKNVLGEYVIQAMAR